MAVGEEKVLLTQVVEQVVEVVRLQLLTAIVMVAWVVVITTTPEEEELLSSTPVLGLNTITVQQVVLEQQDSATPLWIQVVRDKVLEAVVPVISDLVDVVARLVGIQVMTALDHVQVMRLQDKEVLFGILIYYSLAAAAAVLEVPVDLVVQ